MQHKLVLTAFLVKFRDRIHILDTTFENWLGGIVNRVELLRQIVGNNNRICHLRHFRRRYPCSTIFAQFPYFFRSFTRIRIQFPRIFLITGNSFDLFVKHCLRRNIQTCSIDFLLYFLLFLLNSIDRTFLHLLHNLFILCFGTRCYRQFCILCQIVLILNLYPRVIVLDNIAAHHNLPVLRRPVGCEKC